MTEWTHGEAMLLLRRPRTSSRPAPLMPSLLRYRNSPLAPSRLPASALSASAVSVAPCLSITDLDGVDEQLQLERSGCIACTAGGGAG